MKKILSVLLVMALCLSVVVSAATMDTTVNPQLEKKHKQMEIINKFQDNSNKASKEFKLEWNQEKGIPGFVSGKLSDKTVKDSKEAVDFLLSNNSLFKLDKAEYIVNKVEKDQLGMQHFRTILASDGIPVFGADLVLHTDNAGYVTVLNGTMENTVPDRQWSKDVKINEAKAIESAQKSLNLSADTTYNTAPTAKLYIYNNQGVWQPAYLVKLQFMQPYAANMTVFVNAETGAVLKSLNEIMDTAATGTGVGVYGNTRALKLDYVSSRYYMRDTTKGALLETYDTNKTPNLPGTMVSDTDTNFNASTQAPAVDAHANTEIVYNYYKNNFNRNSFDNAGATMKATVNYRETSGTPYNNAFWNGSQMVYGDGDGVNLGPVGSALDVVGHEFTHAVTERTANLVYQDQSGALNESMSDVFGYLIEGDATDWLMGEDCYTPGTPGDAFRSLQDPTIYGDPDHMSKYNYSTSDNGGVHTNSGITNKAFYLAATSINNMSKMSQIYYRALTVYLTSNSQFIDARNALIQAATDLYGASSAEVTAIGNAFTQVGIGGTTSGDTYESNNTTATAYGPLTSGTTYNSYIYSSTDVDYYYFNTAATGTISVTLGNLAGDYDLYLYNSAGTQVAKSENGSTTSESISYSATTTGKFYVKVVGYSGAYSTSTAYALKATYPTSSGSTAQWYYENTVIQSAHNYTNNYNGTSSYTKTGATAVAVHFSRFETESGYDYVYIKDVNGTTQASYTGTQAAFWAQVNGSKINVNLVTDSSVTAYGYYIDQVAYYANGMLIIENVAPPTVGDAPVVAPSSPVDIEKAPKDL